MITLKRAYEAKGCVGTKCFLVERLWPRGIKKEELPIDSWVQDVAPSHQLQRWFRHDPVKWDEFRHRYFAELDAEPQVWKPLVEAAQRGNITFVYSSHDPVHNNAVALKQYLETKMAFSTQAA